MKRQEGLPNPLPPAEENPQHQLPFEVDIPGVNLGGAGRYVHSVLLCCDQEVNSCVLGRIDFVPTWLLAHPGQDLDPGQDCFETFICIQLSTPRTSGHPGSAVSHGYLYIGNGYLGMQG